MGFEDISRNTLSAAQQQDAYDAGYIQTKLEVLKLKASEMLARSERQPRGRALSLLITKLDEARLWLNEADAS